MSDKKIEINNVKNRFLPIPQSAAQGLEPEPKISDFSIIKELGSGSFGRVYLVVHKMTKVQYAIKAIDKRNNTNIEEKPYFRREVEVMYKIHHPNVVKLFGHFEDNNYCYFIMEYISKGSVFSLIPTDKKKRINTQVVASLIKDVISAVYFLHNMKPMIIHRDIKPENVLLSEGLVAKLTDFGWSNYMQEDEKRTTVCGTPIYLAPEIIKEEGHDEKVDIWCIGVLLFELITGNVPFQGNDIETLKKNILNLKIAWPKDINTDAKGLIMKILKLEPSSRISLSEMLQSPFITKYFPNAAKQFLIKPDENAQYKPFVVSKDDPKTWKPENESSTSPNNDVKKKEIPKEQEKDKSLETKANKEEKKIPKEFTPENFKFLKEKYIKIKADYESLKKGGKPENEIDELKNLLKEKEERIAHLVGISKSSGEEVNESYLKMKCDELEKKNSTLKEKLSHYQKFINEQGGENIDNKLNALRDSVKGDNKDSISTAMESLKSHLSAESKKHLNEIIKEKEKEIQKIKEEEKIRREKENKKYTAIINKYNKAVSHYEKENKELKNKLKKLKEK